MECSEKVGIGVNGAVNGGVEEVVMASRDDQAGGGVGVWSDQSKNRFRSFTYVWSPAAEVSSALTWF